MNMKLMDSALIINGVVSSCKCRCRHCLLCSGDRLVPAVPFEKLQALAMKFEGFEKSTGINVGLAVYHSADYPQLPAAMEVDRKISKINGYQNLNGTPVRKGKGVGGLGLLFEIRLQSGACESFLVRDQESSMITLRRPKGILITCWILRRNCADRRLIFITAFLSSKAILICCNRCMRF